MTQNVVYLGECFMGACKKKNVYAADLAEIIYRYQLYSVDLWYCSAQLYPYCFSSRLVCPFLMEGC